MIDYIKYTVDGKTYSLINDNGVWTKDLTAPSIAGRYDVTITISEDGNITVIDSENAAYDLYLYVIDNVEKKSDIIKYLIPELWEMDIFKTVASPENDENDILYSLIYKYDNNLFIDTAGPERVTRIENFLGIKGEGTLSQRKRFLLSIEQKDNKTNSELIKEIVKRITGSDCIITFYGSSETDNPYTGYGYLDIKVLNPAIAFDYKFTDVERSLANLIPAHIKLVVIRYFSTWNDIKTNFESWATIRTTKTTWSELKNYIPPM